MLIFLVILGSLLISYGLIAIKIGAASSFFPPVEGIIVESKIIELTQRVKHQEDSELKQWEKLFQPSILYEYTHNGSSITSSSLSVNLGEATILHGSKSKAETSISKYPLGKKVAVYRRKSGPEFSVIELGAPRAVKIAIFLGSIVLFSAALLRFVAGAV